MTDAMREKLVGLKKFGGKSLNLFLDFLFPESEELCQLKEHTAASFAERARRAEETEHADLVLFDYRDPLVTTLIWEIKYRGNPKLLTLGAELIYDELMPFLEEERMWENFSNPLLIPIPLSKKRERERGFNQCELIGRELQKLDQRSHFIFSPTLLLKTRHTESQTRENRASRLKNLHGCFSVPDASVVAGKNIILLDDVVTTGATLDEASKVLKDAGARRVVRVALAH